MGARKTKALNLGIPARKVDCMGLNRTWILSCSMADDGPSDGKISTRPAILISQAAIGLFFTIWNI
jgi:hypothetical protein